MSKRHYYLRGVPAPAPQRRAARAVLRRVCPALGITARLRWMLPNQHAETMERHPARFLAPDGGGASVARDQSVLGLAYQRGEILIRADLRTARVPFVAAHEARHVWQWAHGWDMTDARRIEADANDYASAALRFHAGALRAALPPGVRAEGQHPRAALRAN